MDGLTRPSKQCHDACHPNTVAAEKPRRDAMAWRVPADATTSFFLRDASGRHSTSPFLVVGRDGEGYFARYGRGGVLPKMDAMRGLGHLRLIPRNLKTDDDTARLNCLPPPTPRPPNLLALAARSPARREPVLSSSTRPALTPCWCRLPTKPPTREC